MKTTRKWQFSFNSTTDRPSPNALGCYTLTDSCVVSILYQGFLWLKTAELFHSLRSQQRENIALRIQRPLKSPVVARWWAREFVCIRVYWGSFSVAFYGQRMRRSTSQVCIYTCVFTQICVRLRNRRRRKEVEWNMQDMYRYSWSHKVHPPVDALKKHSCESETGLNATWVCLCMCTVG